MENLETKQNRSIHESLENVTNNPIYQAELGKIQEYYGKNLVLDSYEEAQLLKRRVWDYRDICYREDLRIRAAKTIIVCEFTMKLHKRLERGLSAEKIIFEFGNFEDYLKLQIYPKGYGLFRWGKEIYNAIIPKRKWWLVEE